MTVALTRAVALGAAALRVLRLTQHSLLWTLLLLLFHRTILQPEKSLQHQMVQ